MTHILLRPFTKLQSRKVDRLFMIVISNSRVLPKVSSFACEVTQRKVLTLYQLRKESGQLRICVFCVLRVKSRLAAFSGIVRVKLFDIIFSSCIGFVLLGKRFVITLTWGLYGKEEEKGLTSSSIVSFLDDLKGKKCYGFRCLRPF